MTLGSSERRSPMRSHTRFPWAPEVMGGAEHRVLVYLSWSRRWRTITTMNVVRIVKLC